MFGRTMDLVKFTILIAILNFHFNNIIFEITIKNYKKSCQTNKIIVEYT
jgi:hypothetical protein